jgi:hypothetical protein
MTKFNFLNISDYNLKVEISTLDKTENRLYSENSSYALRKILSPTLVSTVKDQIIISLCAILSLNKEVKNAKKLSPKKAVRN